MACLYTAYRCKSLESDEQKGASHYSDDGEYTLCGKTIDEHWYISDNTFTGEATCPECARIDKETNLVQRRKIEKKRNGKSSN